MQAAKQGTLNVPTFHTYAKILEADKNSDARPRYAAGVTVEKAHETRKNSARAVRKNHPPLYADSTYAEIGLGDLHAPVRLPVEGPRCSCEKRTADALPSCTLLYCTQLARGRNRARTATAPFEALRRKKATPP